MCSTSVISKPPGVTVITTQAELLLKVFEYVSQTDCAGVSIWQYADTRSYVSSSRIFARARGFNNKGIVDEYRRPKLAWNELQKFLCK